MNPATARRLGMTLIEMLVALTATLILMSAVAQMFSVFGAAMSGSRAMLDLDAQMRNVAWRLRSDLAGATARPLPPLPADSGEGYFEIIEGPMREPYQAEVEAAGGLVAHADVDDALLFTARSTDVPFIGRAPTDSTNAAALQDSFESTLAEIGWFTRKTLPETTPVTYTLYRKQFLVMGYVGTDPFSTSDNNSHSLGGAAYTSALERVWTTFFSLPVDISVRREVNRLYPNALADLTRREFRFMHNVSGTVSPSAFPYRFPNHQAPSLTGTTELLPRPALDGLIFDSTSARQGEDVVLTNVLAFDVRVFDPAAPVALSASGNTALVPGDLATFPGGPVASGCYVDLGNGVTGNSLLALASGTIRPRFAGVGEMKSKLIDPVTNRRTYDTWSTHYEANGIDEDDWIDSNNNGRWDPGENVRVDQAVDGEDDNTDGVIDDPGEFETSPPYPFPLRGIEVRIRCYEPSSRQVRQVTVRHTFVPH